MKDEYWSALLKGLTPDSPHHVNLWWKAPLIILAIFFIIAGIS